MDLSNPIAFIRLGLLCRYLTSRQAGDRVDGEGNVLSSLGRVEASLERLDFPVSLRAFQSVCKPIVTTLHERVQATPALPVELDAQLARQLISEVSILEVTILSEAETHVIAIPVRRRFEFDILANSPSKLFAPGVFESLPEIAKSDIVQACRCILFECPTAAAFHTLRCCEECVRVVYRAYFPREDASRAWGVLEGELGKKTRAPRPSKMLLDSLRDARQNFRNPTQHPEMVYDLDEAQDLLHVAISLITRCVRDPRVVERSSK